MAVDKLVDSTQLDSDLTSVANAIRTRGGTSAQLAFPNGFVSAVGAIGNQYSAGDEGKVVSSGALVSQTSDTVTENDTYDTTLINSLTVNVSGGGSTDYPYMLGTYGAASGVTIEVYKNHVKITSTSNNTSGATVGLRKLDGTLNIGTQWFAVNSGSTIKVEYKNVVNSSNLTWNANGKKTGTNTSLSFGIGNGTHTSGATYTGTVTSDTSVGQWFVYIASMPTGTVLEFDMEISIDGTRIL